MNLLPDDLPGLKPEHGQPGRIDKIHEPLCPHPKDAVGSRIEQQSALLLGLFQLTQRRAGPELWELIRTGKALYLFPLAAAFGLLTAGFTEEFFFRGFLQTRAEKITGSPWIAVLVATLAFGLYHVPFAYLNPNWPSAGDFPAALQVGMVEGSLGGIILGAAYVLWKRNLLACIVLHGMIDAVPSMTMIKFGGS